MSGKETNYKEKYLNLKKTLQEYELLFADYEKQEKKIEIGGMVLLFLSMLSCQFL